MKKFLIDQDMSGCRKIGDEIINRWINARQGKYLCECGCKEKIKITLNHFYKRNSKTELRIPRFIRYHRPHGVKMWNWKGGKPICLRCNKKVLRYGYKLCMKCKRPADHPMWSGGLGVSLTKKKRQYHKRYASIQNDFFCTLEDLKETPDIKFLIINYIKAKEVLRGRKINN